VERALLVRHAESVFSARGITNGKVDVRCPLSARGETQARALAQDIADEDIDLCVTSELERTRQTADVALADRAVPRIVFPELNDPLYGTYESGPLDAYVAWALANDPAGANSDGSSSLAMQPGLGGFSGAQSAQFSSSRTRYRLRTSSWRVQDVIPRRTFRSWSTPRSI
jgi:Histidine phosphatase superfamily (branch 1)